MAQRLEDIVWPGWEVFDKLGEGSFGGVYEIRRILPDGTVERAALKKLTVPKDPGEIAELCDQSYDSASITAHFKEQMQDLVREYTLMQKLGENPNVVHCQDLRTIQHEDGIGWDIYIRMELLTPLKQYLGQDYAFQEKQVIRLGLDMCNVLQSCHEHNIIHRDIKPENILVTDDGRFKLGDFGIAKVSEKTATGTLTGTYSYMAPEIANRQHYGTSADIYSLGLVMYWMMNERTLPFLPLSKKIPSSIQKQEAQERRFSGEPLPSPLNGSLELTRIVLKACAFYPKNRFSSAQEFSEALQNCLLNTSEDIDNEETVLLNGPNAGSLFSAPRHPNGNRKKDRKRWSKRPWIGLVAGIAAILCILFSVKMIFRGNHDAVEGAILQAEQPSSTEASTGYFVPDTAVESIPEPEHVVSTATVGSMGELLMHTPVMNSCAQPDGSYDFSPMFRYVKPVLAENDYNTIGLETTFSGGFFTLSATSSFNCPDQLAESVKDAGYDMLVTANNHCADHTITGITRTLDIVHAAGLTAIGTRISTNEPRYQIVEINDIKIGMACYTYTTLVDDSGRPKLNGGTPLDRPELVNYFDYNSLDSFYEEVKSILESMQADGAETNMFFVHWGTEYELSPDYRQTQIAQKLCDLGVQVIVGGHPHVVQPISLLQSQTDPTRKTICINSLGSAMSNQRRSNNGHISTPHTEDGALFRMTFEKYSDGTVYAAAVDVIPIWIILRESSNTYSILPLQKGTQDTWVEKYELNDTMMLQCQESYDRTMEIIEPGLLLCQEYLQTQKQERDESYYQQALQQ